MGATPTIEIRPHAGPQELFLSTPADIAIYGGAAGGGKTAGLCLEGARHTDNPRYGGVIFRRRLNDIWKEGGLWHSAAELYPLLSGRPVLKPMAMYRFPSGARVSFDHLNLESDVFAHQGAQYPFIGYDEITHFTRFQFFYMLSRNRSMSGVTPYVRGTCNPDPDSWVAEFIAWWIDQETGYFIPERSGKIRWMLRVDDSIEWADTREQLVAKHGCDPNDPKSVTFIGATIQDNPTLLAKDPRYLANLKALPRVERERLLGGNWKIRPAAGLYFMRGDVAAELGERPPDVRRWVRAWDLAATEPSEAAPDPDWTVGVLMGRRRPSQRLVVADVIRVRRRASEVRRLVRQTAEQDGVSTTIRLFQDPGQAGKDQAQSYVTALEGFPVFTRNVTGDKVTRAEPFAAQWQAHNVEVVKGPWLDAFYGELEGFPEAKHDDQVDAAAEAFHAIRYPGDSNIAGALPRESFSPPS